MGGPTLGFGLPAAGFLRFLLPSSLFLLSLLYFTGSHRSFLPLLPDHIFSSASSHRLAPLSQLLTTSYSAQEVHDAGFDTRAFQISHHLPARVDAYIPANTAVQEAYDADLLAFGSVAGVKEDKVTDQLIPRAVYQTWKTDVVGPKMLAAMESWIEMNPEYEYLFLNDSVANTYVAQYTGPSDSAIAASTALHVTPGRSAIESPFFDMFVQKGCARESNPAPTAFALTSSEVEIVQQTYLNCQIGASRADLLRLLLIYQFGGVYFDADTACNRPLREWVAPGATFVTGQGGRGDLMQWGMIASPAHPIIAQALRASIRSTQRRGAKMEDWVEYIAGPPIFWEGAREVMCNPELGGVLDRMQAYKQDQFGGRVAFKAPGVDRERQHQGHKHWTDQQGDLRHANKESKEE